MVTEIHGNSGFANIANFFQNNNKNIRLKTDAEGDVVLYTNSTRFERLKDWFLNSRTEREQNREAAKQFILKAANENYGVDFSISTEKKGALTGKGLSKLRDRWDSKQQEVREAGRQKMAERVKSPQFAKLFKAQVSKFQSAKKLEVVEKILILAIEKHKVEIDIKAAQGKKDAVQQKLSQIQEETDKIRKDPNYLINHKKINGKSIGVAHVKDEEVMESIKKNRDEELSKLNDLMGQFKINKESFTKHLQHNSAYGNFVAQAEVTVDDDGAEWTVSDEMGDIDNEIYTEELKLKSLLEETDNCPTGRDLEEADEIRNEILILQKKKTRIEINCNGFLNGNLQDKAKKELDNAEKDIKTLQERFDKLENEFQKNMKEIPVQAMSDEIKDQVLRAKDGLESLKALQNHLNAEMLAKKLGDGNIKETIDQLRSNIEDMRKIVQLSRLKNVPVGVMKNASDFLDEFESIEDTVAQQTNLDEFGSIENARAQQTKRVRQEALAIGLPSSTIQEVDEAEEADDIQTVSNTSTAPVSVVNISKTDVDTALDKFVHQTPDVSFNNFDKGLTTGVCLGASIVWLNQMAQSGLPGVKRMNDDDGLKAQVLDLQLKMETGDFILKKDPQTLHAKNFDLESSSKISVNADYSSGTDVKQSLNAQTLASGAAAQLRAPGDFAFVQVSASTGNGHACAIYRDDKNQVHFFDPEKGTYSFDINEAGWAGLGAAVVNSMNLNRSEAALVFGQM